MTVLVKCVCPVFQFSFKLLWDNNAAVDNVTAYVLGLALFGISLVLSDTLTQ